jgi:integrase
MLIIMPNCPVPRTEGGLLMPAHQQGSVYKLGKGRYGIRWYDAEGIRHRKSSFDSRSAARKYYRDVIEPQLLGRPAPMPELTLAQLVALYLERHAVNVRPRTIGVLRERLAYATKAYGDTTLRDLERMGGDLATWQTKLPERSRYAIMSALRQALSAAERWGYMSRNPAVLAGRNPQPPPRTVRAYTTAELDAIAAELSAIYRPLPMFAAATGLRPEEWAALERRDIDRVGIVNVRRTVSDGEIVELGKTTRSRRQVPLSARALAALDELPPRLDTPRIFSAPRGGLLHLNNFRRREWAPAIEAAGIARPARIYDLRSTFASRALAAGVSAFELAKIMGTSIQMIELHYGKLLDGAGAGISARLDAYDAQHDQATETNG